MRIRQACELISQIAGGIKLITLLGREELVFILHKFELLSHLDGSLFLYTYMAMFLHGLLFEVRV